MTFMEGFDGHLHIMAVPSEEPEDVRTGNTLTYSLKRNQPVMPVRSTRPLPLHCVVVPLSIDTAQNLTLTRANRVPPVVYFFKKKDASAGATFQSLTRDLCLMDRSTDYDPYHTWVPPAMRRTCPWPTTGPQKPAP